MIDKILILKNIMISARKRHLMVVLSPTYCLHLLKILIESLYLLRYG